MKAALDNNARSEAELNSDPDGIQASGREKLTRMPVNKFTKVLRLVSRSQPVTVRSGKSNRKSIQRIPKQTTKHDSVSNYAIQINVLSLIFNLEGAVLQPTIG